MGTKINPKDRIGQIIINNFGEQMEIIEYYNATNMTTKFDDGNIVYNIQYDNFLKGKVKNPYSKTLYGVACCGDTRNIKDDKLNEIYDGWHNMIERCYANQKNSESYKIKNCYVCDEWLTFLNYYKWYKQNYYEVENETMCLDKDILVKRNNCYSPETCVFVPSRINMLFIKNKHNKTTDNPIGVQNTKYNTYRGVCRTINGKIERKSFKTKEEAFCFYKEIKEREIKKMAEIYKNKIPQKLYDAMYEYKVEIDD